ELVAGLVDGEVGVAGGILVQHGAERRVEHDGGVVGVHGLGDGVVAHQVDDGPGLVAGNGEGRRCVDRGVTEESVGGGPVGVGPDVVPVGEPLEARHVVGRYGSLVLRSDFL